MKFVLPCYGEFGHLIMKHIRWVHVEPGEKIVSCERGQEVLFPSAKEFYFDWDNPIHADDRCDVGSRNHWWLCSEYDNELRHKFRGSGYEIVRPTYDCPWHMSDSIKFPLFPKHELSCDIVLGARFRNFAPERNWEHWQLLIDLLHCEGLNVGIAGTKGGCYNLQADVYAWDHTRGHTEGSVDLLKNCKVYCGIDSGVTHLASFLDTNSVIFRREYPGNYDLTGMFRRANKGKYMQLEDSAWDNPFTIAKGVIDAYSSCSIGK